MSVDLNVGGVFYTTHMATLTSVPDSYFCTLFSQEEYIEKDNQGRVLIDRDGKLFRHVLQFLRNGPNTLLPEKPSVRAELRMEADFFRLPQLVEMIDRCDPNRIVTLRFYSKEKFEDLEFQREKTDKFGGKLYIDIESQWSDVEISLAELSSQPQSYFWHLANNIGNNTMDKDKYATYHDGWYYVHMQQPKTNRKPYYCTAEKYHEVVALVCKFLKIGIVAVPQPPHDQLHDYEHFFMFHDVAMLLNMREALAYCTESDDRHKLVGWLEDTIKEYS